VLARKNLGPVDVELALRAGRATYPEPPQPRGALTKDLPLPCDHVDHETRYWIYVPKSYDRGKATPLLLVVHAAAPRATSRSARGPPARGSTRSGSNRPNSAVGCWSRR